MAVVLKKGGGVVKKVISKGASNGKAAPVKKAAAKKEAAVEKEATGVGIGVSSGLRIGAAWAALFAANDKAKLTDEQLLESMREDFPNHPRLDEVFTLKRVKDMRWYYNKGKLGVEPKKESIAYDADGKPAPKFQRTGGATREERLANLVTRVSTRLQKHAERVGKLQEKVNELSAKSDGIAEEIVKKAGFTMDEFGAAAKAVAKANAKKPGKK